MTQLEKAARVLKRKLNESGYLDYEEAVRAVISSIEVDDAMVEVATLAWYDSHPDVYSRSIPAALKAFLRSLLEGERGK